MSLPRPAQLSPNRVAFVLLAMVTLCWGINWPIMKLAVAEVPVWSFRAICAGAGALGLLGIAAATGQRFWPPSHQWGRLILVAIPNVMLWNVLGVYGLKLLPSGRAAILAFTMPLWAVLLSMLVLGERLTPNRALGLLFGMAGMAVLMGGEAAHLAEAPVGSLLMIAAAFSWGAGTVLLKRFPIDLPTTALTGWLLVLGGVPMLAGALIIDPPIPWPPSHAALFAVVYNMLIAFIFCYWAWFKIVSLVPVNVSAMGSLMIPVVGTLSGMLLLGESVGWQEAVALALVLAAVATVLRPASAAAARAGAGGRAV
ncbi:MAG: DMT family transporter [Proteobacteria bacterium]|nr:DMT family transporter [Pseudomonadota bacterium]MBI3497755.1 DMT family transporter [Pseudomonadota bacterium]